MSAEMMLMMRILVRASVGGWAMLGGREGREGREGIHELKTSMDAMDGQHGQVATLAQQHTRDTAAQHKKYTGPIENPAVNVEGGGFRKWPWHLHSSKVLL
ncbi:hypothetical protein EAF00_011439 [Botryotinia globosa]|nr:hypothetical protein EAF00_011439 [Botryotinia globosa]